MHQKKKESCTLYSWDDTYITMIKVATPNAIILYSFLLFFLRCILSNYNWNEASFECLCEQIMLHILSFFVELNPLRKGKIYVHIIQDTSNRHCFIICSWISFWVVIVKKKIKILLHYMFFPFERKLARLHFCWRK